MKIAILGTRGIPNNYGGFEQFAEYLSTELVKKEHEVFVYSPHNHTYSDKLWNSVHIIHKYDPEYKIGTVGQFIYDLNCILDSRKRGFDIILQLGYTSSSVWSFLFKKNTCIVTNMDGLEWKRTKYGKLTRRFLAYAEKLAVKNSNYLVSDSLGIKRYIQEKYNCDSVYIPYGADVFNHPDETVLKDFALKAYCYDMLIARLEPENSIESILDGVALTATGRSFIVIGNFKTAFGAYLTARYKQYNHILFLGSIYDMKQVNNLRYFSNLYFHGHTVGGTNPSLLEAMASGALIAAHQNEFNSSILGEEAYYFSNANDVAHLINTVVKNDSSESKILANTTKIASFYSWETITEQYEKLFVRIKKGELAV